MSLTGQNDASPTRGYARHKEALFEYQKALAIDSEVGKGPGFMERFLHNKPKTPDLRERVKFLEETLTTENG